MFADKAGADPSEVPLRCSGASGATVGYYKLKTRPGRLAKDKHSSLLQKSINYDSKKFYGIGQSCKICYSHILQFFCKKLDRLSLASLSTLVQCLRVRQELTRVKHLSGAWLGSRVGSYKL